jgi:release factor glutamine methyltransferase
MATERSAPPATVDALLRAAARELAAASESPRLDAELLLAHALGVGRVDLYRTLFDVVPDAAAGRFGAALAERSAGRPVAQLTGTRDFWTLSLAVTRATLTPRPETEVLVARALELLPADATGPVLDLGTGTGAIALALATERPRLRVVATDLSKPALTVARGNARRLGLRNVRFHLGDWFGALPAPARFAVIVSNPPYVTPDELATGDRALGFEPRLALLGGRDGLDAYRAIVGGAPAHLAAGGTLLVEHGATQGEAVRGLFARHGFRNPRTLPDLAGRPRVTEGRLP